MAAHDLINAAIKANDKAMKTAIKNGYPVQLPADQYLPKAMNGNIDVIHLGQFADLDAGFDEYRKQQAAQPVEQDFADLDAGFAEWSAAQGGQASVDAPGSGMQAVGTGSTSVGGQSSGSRSTKANTGGRPGLDEIPQLDNMAVPVTAKATTKTVTKAEKKAEKEVKQANSLKSKADKTVKAAEYKAKQAEKNLMKKSAKAEAEAQKADALQGAAKVTKKGNTTVIEPAQNVQQTKRKMQNLAKEEARAQAEYTKAQEDTRKAEERARKAADRQQAANDRAQAVSAFAARRTANSGTVSSAEQATNNAVRRDIIDQAVNNQISSYDAIPKASAVKGTSGRVHSGSGRGFVPDESPVVQELIPTLDASVQNLVPTLDVNERIQQRQAEAREATSGRPVASTNTTTPEMDLMQSAVRADALRPQSESSRRLSYLSYLSDPNRRLTKEEQDEAEQLIRAYNKEHHIHGGNDGYYDGPNDPLSPEYLEYAAVQRLKAKTTGGAIGSGISDAYNLFNGLLPEGAAKLADFVTGDPNNSFSQSIRQANDLRDQTMQASRTQAPLAYAGGNMAGKMSQYAATNGLFDSFATGALGLEAGSEAAFWANQIAQNAQDWAINEIPDYIQNRQNGMSQEEALRNFGREALIDAGGNVTMGALSDYVIPSLVNRFGRGAAESAGDAARTVMPDDVMSEMATSGRLYDDLTSGTGAQIPELTDEVETLAVDGFGRQADDVADAVKAAPEAVAPGRVTEDQWGSLIDGMRDIRTEEGADIAQKYIRTVQDYEAGRATLDDVDEAFEQAQYELGEAGLGRLKNDVNKIINPDYSGQRMIFDSAVRKYGEKYPEATASYRQAQDAYNKVIADPNSTRDQIIEASDQLKRTARSLESKIKTGESADPRGALDMELAEIKRHLGTSGDGTGTVKVYADPEWADSQFGYKKRVFKKGQGVFSETKKGKTKLYKYVTAQERLKGSGITLVDDPAKASGGLTIGKKDLGEYLKQAIDLQAQKGKARGAVDTGIGRYSDDIINARTNQLLESRGLERATPPTQAELDYLQSLGQDMPQAGWGMLENPDDAFTATRRASAELPELEPEEVTPPDNWQALFDEAPARAMAEDAGIGRGVEETTGELPFMDEADEVADTANHANRSNNVTMTEAELDEAIKDVPELGPKVDPVDRQLEKVSGQTGKSREYIGKTRTNSIQNSGIDDLAEQTDVIPESMFKHSSTPEKQTMHNAYLKVELEQQAQIDRFAKRMTSEELGQLGSEDVDTMFILRNVLNKQAREATDEATKAELYRLSREVALNIDQVGHSRGQTLQSFRKWAHTYDGAVATAEGRLYKTVDDQLRANPKMQAEIDSVAHQIFDRIGEIDSLDDARKQVHDIVRQAMEDSRYLKGKVDDATVTKLTDSILKEKSFEGIQEQLDFLATGQEHLSMDTLDKVQKLFDEASEFDYGSKDYYQREMQAYALLANDMFQNGSTFRNKFDQWRYFAMLANPTTHIKNMTGNVLFGQGAVGIKNNLAAIIEASADRVSKVTGGKGIERTKAILNPIADRDLLKASRQDAFDKSYRALTGTGRYLDPARGIDQATPTWSTKSRVGRALNAVTGFNNRLLSGEDEVAMIAKYQTSLAGYLKANGYGADIFKATDDKSMGVLESARAYALRQAQEAAFHQDSNLAKQMTQFTQNLRNSDKAVDRAVGTAADIAIPFKKTPINILKSCFAYSPVEFAKVAAEIPDLYKGVIKPADFIDDLSKGLTGTAGLVAGALLAHGGIIEAGTSKGDKETSFDKTAGRQNNAVKIGGKQVGLAELVPAAAPIIFGAIMYETKRDATKNGNAALDTIVNGSMGLTDAVTDMTMLSGIADIIADAKSAQSKGETFTNIASGLAENLVGQMLPTVGRKAEITVDDTKRSTYSDRTGTMKQLDSSAKYWQTKIPGSQALGEKLEQSDIPMLQSVGSRLTLEPAVDAWGREIKQTGGNIGGRAAYNFLSPVTISEESQDPTDQELYALSDQTGSDDVFHQMPQTDSKFKNADGEDVKLSESQWTEYQKLNGTRAKELVDALVNSELYAGMSDDDKVEAIKNIYSYTKDAAQHEVGGKALNSTNAKMDAAYQAGGAEGLIQELEYRNGIATAQNETGLEIANNSKTRGVYEEYGAEGVQAYAEMKDQFNAIKAGREEQYGKGSKNVNIMTTLTLLNENPDQAEVILGSIASNPDKYEQTENGWIYHQGDNILSADDVTEPVVTEEPGTVEEEPIAELEQPQPSQAKAVSRAQRDQRAALAAAQQQSAEAEEIPALEEPVQEEPKPAKATTQQASNVEINPATGRPVVPNKQTAQADTEIDPITGRPKLKKQTQEIPKLEPNGNATWSNDWEIEDSKSWQRFKAIDSSFTTQDYARVYNAMDKDRSGKVKKDEIVAYLDRQSMDDAYKAALYDAFARAGTDNPYKKK